ncbi:hypothetical protein BBP40_004171 [Aspergillus hancockii]|nr:hypothetical protein BBP40_004171 [Aspergillus hancockii]
MAISIDLTIPRSPGLRLGSRRVSGLSGISDRESVENHSMARSVISRRVSSRKFNMTEMSNLSTVLAGLKRRSGDELGTITSSSLSEVSYETLMDWIRSQRMTEMPPEGSSYDKVLAWAQLFVERLHSCGELIEELEGGSYDAAQLAYGYCHVLLTLGEENAPALMTSFGFFYSISTALANLLERTDLFSVTQETQEQLVLALLDLVRLVHGVATHFYQATSSLTTASISVNIYETFSGQIQTFRDRCENIADSMWRHQFLRQNLDADQVKQIQAWLAPEDRVLADVADATSQLAQDREELTCLWVKQYLTRFLKSQQLRILSLAGKPGSGKSVLASVIVDHLQHPIGGVSYKTLFVPLNGRIFAETTPRALVKTILYQLFQKRIGNVQLFQILSDAYQRSKQAANNNDFDNILWNSLEHSLGAALLGAKELVIVVDGLDEAYGGEEPLLQRLISVTANATNVKLITLGAQTPPTRDILAYLPVTEDRIFDDISAVVKGHLQPSKVFSGMSEMDQETVVDRITQASKGSFLWAKLATKSVRHESNAESVLKALDTLVNMKFTIADFVHRFLQSPDVDEPAKMMLLWLATAERPFTLKELGALASIQVEKQTVIDRHVDVLHILRPLNSLVFLQNGHVYLRHGLIREAVLDVFQKGKLIPTIKDRHADLVTRLLIYIKCTITQQHELSLTSLDWHDTNLLVNKHPLLDFAIQYWPLHLRQTSTFVKGGEAQTAKEFSKVFPTLTTVFLLQRTLWENKPTPVVLLYQTTITNLCRRILTQDHVLTLQSIVLLALLYRQLDYFPEAVSLFHEATTISRKLLTTRHLVTMQLASIFLDMTVTKVTKTKSDIMIQREETLLILAECYKLHYGETSEKVTSTLRQLLEHYRSIQEEQKAQEILVSIESITDIGYTGAANNGRTDLDIELRRRLTPGPLPQSSLSLDAEEQDVLVESVESFDFEKLLGCAATYIADGRLEHAERTYVEIWQRACTECRMQYSALWEERKMVAVLNYTRFLLSQKRKSEAASILSGLWHEYEQSSLSISETIIAHLQEAAKVMDSMGLDILALSVFKHCAQYYQNSNLTQIASYEELQQSIQTISKKVMQSVSSSSTVISETTLEEIVYEVSTSITTVDQSSFTATHRLIELYESQHRWQDATRAIKRILRGLWPSFFASSLQDVAVPVKHAESCVALAERLSHCYHARRRLIKEEDSRTRIYHAIRSHRAVDDKLRVHVTRELLHFFDRVSQTDKAIALHQEMLDDYISHYGREHSIVIKELWVLAELTRPRPIFIDYYQQIIRTLNKESKICHRDAFEPLIIVATELWNQGRYSDAVQYYSIMYTTHLNQSELSARFQDQVFVQEYFANYLNCLRSVRTEFAVLHKVTVDYRLKCKETFGATTSVTIKATLTLAKLCEESKRYEGEAIALYEELRKVQSEEVNLQEISARLDSIYEAQAVDAASSTSESFSAVQIERTVKVLKKRISTVREIHGWAHEESLSKMTELIIFQSKYEKIETVMQELMEATVQILTTEVSSTRLSAAASAIAASYIAINQVQKAAELTQELYRQIILRDTTNAKSIQFNLSSKERQCLAFLAQFEYSLHRHTSTTITEVLATLTTEYVYFEEFRRLIKAKASICEISMSAARLYQHLVERDRTTAAACVFNEFMSYFLATEGKRTQVTETAQVKIFIQTILRHFSNHQSQNFIRSVGIASNNHIVELLKAGSHEVACDLALASFKYISAHDAYRTRPIVKFVFSLGLAIAGLTAPQPDKTIRKKMISVSAAILRDALRVIGDLGINLATVGLAHLNKLINVLSQQQDYTTLEWVLHILWNRRETLRAQSCSPLTLGRRLAIARYLVGKTTSALRLTEDIVYNCRRVYGVRHASTLEMSVLLSQLYTSVAQSYQSRKGGQYMANRYYKKSAALHENILRVFSDPSFIDLEGSNKGGMSPDNSSYDLDLGDTATNGMVPDGMHVRQHLHLLRLALERLGDWPKEYDEYVRLNADVFREFPDELAGMEGVERWNLKAFGSGKAESDEDVLDLSFQDWDLLETRQNNGNGVEEKP